MSSPLLALFIRSVREDSRLRFTYFSRAALVLLILLFLAMMKSTLGWVNGPGREFFLFVAHIDLCFVGLAGVSYFASSISEEKEEQTLGLLRMTNLNPLSILLGKSTSRLCAAALLLAAQFPFTLLAITLGGVTLQQIMAAHLAIGAFLIFVSGLALLVSVICQRTSVAGVVTGVLLLLFFFTGPIAKWVGGFPAGMGWLPEHNRWAQSFDFISDVAEVTSPFGRVIDLFFIGRKTPVTLFFTPQLLSNVAMGLTCFLLAWLAFERFCGEQKEAAVTRPARARSWRDRQFLRPSRAWRRALAWKEFYFTNGGKRWIGIKMLAYAALLVLLFFIRWYDIRQSGLTSVNFVGFGRLAFGFALMCLLAELSFAAATIFRNEHQGQTLSSLAMLPQGIRRVAYQKLLGLAPALGASSFYCLLSLPLFVLSILQEPSERMTANDVVLGCAFYAAQGLFFLHLVAVLSLRLKRGALPLAIAIEVLLFIFAGWFFGNGIDKDSVIIAITVFTFVVTGLMHASIPWRLEKLAGEG